jgi:tricarballylate dehydrogenase
LLFFACGAQWGVFNPTQLDGKRARGLAINKSNWALPLNTPPFYGFPVVCGITFTFGGIAINSRAAALRKNGKPIAGLFAAGEMVGGLFGENYPGGSGLMSGAVFGKIAGASAARHAKKNRG